MTGDRVRVRELTEDERPAAWTLGTTAFGYVGTPMPAERPPGRVDFGAFGPDGTLLGKAADLHDEQWWLGRPVAAADVAGVAVLPEARGRGVARALLTHLLASARERGAAVSALYPTVAAVYRSLGWEVTGAMRTVDVPAAALARTAGGAAGGLTVRPGGPADLDAAAGLYERVARPRCGLLTRRSPRFGVGPTDRLPDGVDGLTLVEDGKALVGYATWHRGRGYGADSALTAYDLLAETPAAARALAGVLAGWGSVAPTLRLRPLAHDALTALLPLEIAREHERETWMHRPVDVRRAVRDRGWPPHAVGVVDFALLDDVAPWNAGNWRLEVDDGTARLTRLADAPDLTLSVRGFALLYAGAASAASVAEAGLLTGPAGADVSALDLLNPGQPAQLLDYF